MAVTEDQQRDINYFRTGPDLGRSGGGGEVGSLNVPDMIDRIKGPIMEAQVELEEEDHHGRR